MKRVLFVIFLLASCNRSPVYPYHVANITKVCEARGGWAVLDEYGTGRCADGTYVGSTVIDKRP